MFHILITVLTAGSLLSASVGRADDPPAAKFPDYRPVANWPMLPAGVVLGDVSAVATDSKDNVYVAHRGPKPVLVFDRDGKFLRSWGDDHVKTAHGLRIDSEGNVWITDVGHHLVMKFDPEGRLLLSLGRKGRPGSMTDQFDRPTDVAVSPTGEIYVTDGYGNSRVLKFDRAGKLLRQWGTKGSGEGEFNLPHAVCLDAKGRVHVGDRENDRVQIFDSEGKFLEQWKESGAPYGMFLVGDRLFVADGRANWVRVLGPGGKSLGRWGEKGNKAGQFQMPHMLCVDSRGDVYVAEVTNKRIQKFAVAKSAPSDPFNEIDPAALNFEVPSLLQVRTEKDLARVRRELIAFVWKNNGELPTASEVVRTDVEPPTSLAKVPATCETLTVSMAKGFKSVVYHFRPKAPTKKLALFHQGHDHIWTGGGGAETVAFLLEKGFAVMAFQMPLFGDNKLFAPVGITSHNAMEKLVSHDLEPIKFFLEPIVVALNHAAKHDAPDDVVMIGLSGGGWTTTLYAAIDPRIRLSFPVAGTLPDYLRIGKPGDKGDWEQYYPALYKVANYLDLYILGSNGKGRKQRQVLNKYDTCCFWGVGYRTYEKHVTKMVADIGPGSFDVYLDESHRSHLVSQDALKNAIGPLLEDPRPK